VHRLLTQIPLMSLDDAGDLYQAYASRILIDGSDAERLALARARRAAHSAGLEPEYDQARQDAATAWRQALPDGRGPWLLVGHAIANVAGALVVGSSLDEAQARMLIGPWRMAMGTLEPVGPGISTFARAAGR
jgi:hypothetical protein